MAEAIADRYAGIVIDIDGVLLLGGDPVDGAGEAVAALRERGVSLAFVTNNSSRTREQLAEILSEAGVSASPDAVATAALAAAELLEPSTRCLIIGMDGLRSALADRGCEEVDDPSEAEAVVIGWDRHLQWDDLRRATLALEAGARFVGANPDPTYPTSEGSWPGTGATLALLTRATGRDPEIAGKPEAPVFRAAAARLPEGPLLMVGDRPETDMRGAAALGWDTALVLTGVTSAEAAADAEPQPTYVLDHLRGLLDPPD